MAHATRFSVIAVATLSALGGVAGNAFAARHTTVASKPSASQFSDITVRRHAAAPKALVRNGGALAGEAHAPVLVFLNPYGSVLVGGDDNPARNASWIVASASDKVAFPAYRGGARAWQTITTCVRNAYRDFAVDFTDQRPSGGMYSMIVVGGTPNLLGLSDETGGIAPSDGVVLRNAVGFVFSANAGDRVEDVCDAIVHEVGHTLGLDHAYRCEDPMSYLDDCGPKRFADVDAACGEYEARTCDGGKATQNSYRKLMAQVGPRAAQPSSAPTLPTAAQPPPRPVAPPVLSNDADDDDDATVNPYDQDESDADVDDDTDTDVGDDDDDDDDRTPEPTAHGHCPNSQAAHDQRRVHVHAGSTATRRTTRHVTRTTQRWARGRDGNWYLLSVQTRHW